MKGTLYPDRRGNRSRLRGHLEMNISFVLPPALALVPENVRDSLGKGVRTSTFNLEYDIASLISPLLDKILSMIQLTISMFVQLGR